MLDFRGSVAVDLTTQVHFFDLRADPEFDLHEILLSDYDGFLV
jgi:hypothetical protein